MTLIDRNNYKSLQVGDKLKFISIPEDDQKQFEKTGDNFTLRVLKKLVASGDVVTINEIDEFGYPWFEYKLLNDELDSEFHFLAVMSNDGWLKL